MSAFRASPSPPAFLESSRRQARLGGWGWLRGPGRCFSAAGGRRLVLGAGPGSLAPA